MNIKSLGVISFIITSLLLTGSVEETIAQRIARKSRENRISENMIKFDCYCIKLMNSKNQTEMDYETIRCYACFSKYESQRNFFREMHADLPVEYRMHAVEQARRDVAIIVLKK